MLSCGIPELSDLDDLKYVYDALRPHESEADATMYFTRYTFACCLLPYPQGASDLQWLAGLVHGACFLLRPHGS